MNPCPNVTCFASDEADVFLEARGEGDNDLRRNAMVSGMTLAYIPALIGSFGEYRTLTLVVLLRVLEYYDGILILTTNRMRSLDIAVQSRIREFTLSLSGAEG
jgi:hypothetical protein